MMIYVLPEALFLYLLMRFILPLSVSKKAKITATVLLFAIAQQYLLVRSLFGSLSSPELPPWAFPALGFCFAALLLLFAYTLARDMLLLIRRIFGSEKTKDAPRFSSGRRQALLAIAATVPLAACGVREAVAVPEAMRREIRLAKLPPELDGLKIVQISDLHVSALLHGAWVGQVVEKVNALAPDLVLFTGDLVDGSPYSRRDDIAPLRALRARHGVFGCVGNHEYYSDFRGWMKVFPKLGIHMLQNSHSVLKIQGRELVLAGVTDMVAARFGLPEPDPVAAMAGAPKKAFRILMEHRPANAKANAATEVDLQLSGHTHGGQILGVNSLIARFNAGYIRGWYQVDGMPLYVSTGAGLWSGFPIRLGVSPEIAVIVLRAK